MKNNGGTVRGKSAVVRQEQPWRMWLLTLLALGFSLLVITLLMQKNTILTRTISRMNVIAKSGVMQEYPLQFDLPEGWIMTEGCTVAGGSEHVRCDAGTTLSSLELDQLPVLDLAIDPEATTVYLQNTMKLPLFGGIGPDAAVEDAYQSNDVALVTVERVDSQDILLREAGKVTNINGKLFKAQICDVEVSGPECEIYGAWSDEYYFFGETGTYRMNVSSTWSGGSEAIEAILLSARE